MRRLFGSPELVLASVFASQLKSGAFLSMPRAQRKALRLKPVTFPPKKAGVTHSAPAPISDMRIDAIARRGRLMAEISKMGFFLLEEICGRERLLKDVAATIQCSSEYVGQRFDEALTEAADHYGRLPASRPRKRL